MLAEPVYTERYIDFWQWLQGSWIDFIIRYEQGIMTVSEASFNMLCGIFCDWMRQHIREYIERSIEHMKKRQQQRRS